MKACRSVPIKERGARGVLKRVIEKGDTGRLMFTTNLVKAQIAVKRILGPMSATDTLSATLTIHDDDLLELWIERREIQILRLDANIPDDEIIDALSSPLVHQIGSAAEAIESFQSCIDEMEASERRAVGFRRPKRSIERWRSLAACFERAMEVERPLMAGKAPEGVCAAYDPESAQGLILCPHGAAYDLDGAHDRDDMVLVNLADEAKSMTMESGYPNNRIVVESRKADLDKLLSAAGEICRRLTEGYARLKTISKVYRVC
jgi:hypothetical protein